MINILISGYYGFNNIGDESILRTVIDNLRDKLDEIDITVLSQNPAQTAEKYGVKAMRRMSFPDIFKAVRRCDLLLSGGGSLLQDATSSHSILYYLFILFLAQLMGKKTFIYSQGIGPITLRRNRWFTAFVLRRVSGIVVRDSKSRDLLLEIGVPEKLIHVTADPVIRVKKADPIQGLAILEREGCPRRENKLTIGWAVKSRRPDPVFYEEIVKSIRWLKEEYDADSVLIPFFHSEDLSVCETIAESLNGEVGILRQKYLSDETLSIIGCTDILVGIRLHSLIYAAVMGVPMIGISYDPKVDSFLASIDREALCDVKDFTFEKFKNAFSETLSHRSEIRSTTETRLAQLISRLDLNEELIRSIMK